MFEKAVKMKPRYYIQIPERDPDDVSSTWSTLHIVLFILTAAVAFAQAWAVANMLDTYKYRCILFAKMRFRRATYGLPSTPIEELQIIPEITDINGNDNDTKFILEASDQDDLHPELRMIFVNTTTGEVRSEIRVRKSIFATNLMCDFILIAPLISMILSCVFSVLFYLFPNGGAYRPQHALSQSWHLMYPLLLTSGFMLVFLGLSSGIWVDGLNKFCNYWIIFTGEPMCSKKMDQFTIQFHHFERPFYKYFVVGAISSQASILLWAAQTILILVRVVSLGDFSMCVTRVKIKEKDKKDEDEDAAFGKIVSMLLRKGHEPTSSKNLFAQKALPKLRALRAFAKDAPQPVQGRRESEFQPTIIDISTMHVIEDAEDQPLPSLPISEESSASDFRTSSAINMSLWQIPSKSILKNPEEKKLDMPKKVSYSESQQNIQARRMEMPEEDLFPEDKPKDTTDKPLYSGPIISPLGTPKDQTKTGAVPKLKQPQDKPKEPIAPGTPEDQAKIGAVPQMKQPQDKPKEPIAPGTPEDEAKIGAVPKMRQPQDKPKEPIEPRTGDLTPPGPSKDDGTAQKSTPDKEDVATQKSGAIPKKINAKKKEPIEETEAKKEEPTKEKEAKEGKEPTKEKEAKEEKEPTKEKEAKKKEETEEPSRPETSTETEQPVNTGTSTSEDSRGNRDDESRTSGASRRSGKSKTFPKVLFY